MAIGSLPFATPGPQAEITSSEVQIWYKGWGGDALMATVDATIDGAERDAGNTGYTTTLRGGLLLAIDSTGAAVPYDANSTTVGDRIAGGILPFSVKMTDANGGDLDRRVAAVRGGLIKRSEAINLDAQAEAVLVRASHMLFDDPEPNGAAFLPCALTYEEKTADYTVVAADNGKCFLANDASNACAFTLPTIAVGLSFEFLNVNNNGMSIASAETGNIIYDNSLVLDSIAYTGTGDCIGARLRFKAVYLGTTLKWIVETLGPDAQAVTLSP